MQESIDRELEDRDAHYTYFQYWRKLKAGDYDQDFVDAVFLNSWQKEPDIYDAYIFAQIQYAVASGMLIYTKIPAGSEPSEDANDYANNKKLESLPEPFSGSFMGGPRGPGDGHIKWKESLPFMNQYGKIVQEFQPGTATLEVGTTCSTTTAYHLAFKRRLARWPYGQDIIWLFFLIDNEFWTVSYD